MAQESAGSPVPILHVEDDENDILLIQHVFKKEAPRALLFVVRDGEEAVAYLTGRTQFHDRSKFPLPKVVLMDLKLPRKAGLEVIEWMKSQPELKEIPVFVLSSSAQPSDQDRARRLGVTGYLVKQGSLHGLSTVLSEVFAFALETPPE